MARCRPSRQVNTVQVNPAGEIVLECDTDKGEIYVRPVASVAGKGVATVGKPVNLFVSSQHATYTLLLRRSDTPADTIVIRDKAPRQIRAEQGNVNSSARQAQHVRSLKAMLVAMASDRVPIDIRVEDVSRPGPAMGRGELLADAPVRGPGPDRRTLPADQRQQPEHGVGRARVRP